jgi:hypothetical protein
MGSSLGQEWAKVEKEEPGGALVVETYSYFRGGPPRGDSDGGCIFIAKQICVKE